MFFWYNHIMLQNNISYK